VKALFPVLVGALVALVVGDVLILGVGQSPAEVYRLLLEGTWGNPYGFAQVLYKATTLTFTGLAVALALRAGLFNIGAEAQLALGGFAASVMGLVLPVSVPAPLAIIACVIAAGMGGAVGGAVPGALNAFVVLFFLNWVVTAHLHVAETVHTPAFTNGTVPRLSAVIPAFRGSAANATVLLAIAAAVVTGWLVFRTRYGYELRAVGLSPDAAEAAGIVLPRVRVATFTLAGALAGMGGTNFVLGYKHYYEDGFTGGAGLIGIAVALAGRAHPIGIMLAALAFATLSQGGLAIHALVPKQMADILQGVVILAIAIASASRARS
jgi:ABC-type uncharacterized transport system permease subunit